MPFRFCVLGSGSSGNASYLEADGFGVLIDIGLGPRRLASGLAAAAAGWERVQAALLTHTHGDHWRELTLKHLLRRRIPLYCHSRHTATLGRCSSMFLKMAAANLVQSYQIDQPLEVGRLRALPFAVPHDDEPTCGFRLEGGPSGSDWAVGYAADLGGWSPKIASHLSNVDALAVEFNHDVALERHSGRSPMLIDRVLGERGHLSNEQGAGLVAEVLRRSEPGRVQHVVQLHLSRQCNHPRLAREAAARVLGRHNQEVEIHTAHHNAPTPVVRPKRRHRTTPVLQPFLPGWDEEAEEMIKRERAEPQMKYG